MGRAYQHLKKIISGWRTYYEDAPDEIAHRNASAMRYTSLSAAAVIVLFFVIARLIYPSWVPRIPHILFLASMLLFHVYSLFLLHIKAGARQVCIASILLQITILLFVIIIDTSLYPASPALYMSATLIALPVVFMESIYFIVPMYLGSTVLYAVLLFRFKQPVIAQSDLLRLILSTLVSLAVFVLILHLRIQEYQIRCHYQVQLLSDPLTGVLNRFGCESAIPRYLAADTSQQCILVMLDLDNFKNINDQYGHPAGDVVLQEFGALLKRTFRASDTVGRIGGDEFMVLMQGTSAESALQKRYQIITTGMQNISAAHGFPISCSAGAVIVDGPCPSFDFLFHFADDTLYEAKSFGKGSYIVHTVQHTADGGQHLMLVVDDDATTRTLLHTIFEKSHSVIEAADGNAALELISQYRYRIDVILLDILIPGINGLEILQYLKSRRGLSDIPVVIVTADETSESRALQLGACDVIQKPIDPEIIRIRVENAAKKQEHLWFS